MGLGKTLSVCTFLHTILTRAFDGEGNAYVRYRGGREPPPPPSGIRTSPPSALVLVPKAVTTQWEKEFRRWVGGDDEVRVTILGTTSQLQQLRVWAHMGGVLIMNHDAFWRLLSPPAARQNPKAAKQVGGPPDVGHPSVDQPLAIPLLPCAPMLAIPLLMYARALHARRSSMAGLHTPRTHSTPAAQPLPLCLVTPIVTSVPTLK